MFRPGKLWVSIAWPFLLFVIAGSVILTFWTEANARRESRAVFAALAQSNADFLGHANLPATAQMMDYLSRMLNARAFLRENGALVPPAQGLDEIARSLRQMPARGEVIDAWPGYEAVAVPVRPALDLLLLRQTPPAALVPFSARTLLPLGVFWALSVGLALPVAHGVVRPIRLLAARLPHIESDPGATLPGSERRDEVGELARAYLNARAQIAAEREQRLQAERMALLGRMATSLAHEIHNPLSAIRMHTQLAQSGAPGNPPPEFYETLIEETSRIESLVNQWMFLTRPAPPSVSTISLSKIVGDSVSANSAAARHAGATIEANVPESIAVNVDKRRLGQACTNTIINAIQAMPRGGFLKISATSADGFAVLAFHDSGPGFSAGALEHYRDLFYSEKEGGMGIGLTVTAEILEAHGGKLEVANSTSVANSAGAANSSTGGAVVTFHLPLARS
jgi:signal transduction histidine kinase